MKHTHDHEHGNTPDHDHGHCHCGHCHHHRHSGEADGQSPLRLFLPEEISLSLLILCVILRHYCMIPESGWITALAFVLAVLPVGIKIVADCLRLWVKGDFMNEFTLMVLAAAGAFIIGEYPEAVAVLLFYSFGEKLEEQATGKARDRIKALLGKLPDSVTVLLSDGGRQTAKPTEVNPGVTIVVKPGERVAIDGTLLGATPADFDTSAMTGESVPRSIAPGAEVSAGMIPVDREVTLTTLRSFSDSSMSRIMKMIEDAQGTKSNTETMLRRITRWYTPLVMGLAAALFFIPWIVSLFPGADPFDALRWFRRSLVFLVCGCPCALVVSVPLSYFAAIGTASRRGLLFKGGKYIDALRGIDTVAFDKTGTLTTGQFVISSIVPMTGHTADEVLSTAASLDLGSTHPLAKAIVEESRKKSLSIPEAKDVKTVPHGIVGETGGAQVLVGSRKLMEKEGVECGDATGEGTEIIVAQNGKMTGAIYLLDEIKPEVSEAIADLRHEGVRNVTVLSGDRENAVARVAKAAGADSWRAGLLPTDKQNVIKELENEGRRTAFVGDGINDAPAIAASTVGVSMGAMGTDIAMQSADVVIATDRIDKLNEAIRLANRVKTVVTANITFALGVKAAVMILGAFGIATLWAAVFADTGVTLITVIVTLLALQKK